MFQDRYEVCKKFVVYLQGYNSKMRPQQDDVNVALKLDKSNY